MTEPSQFQSQCSELASEAEAGVHWSTCPGCGASKRHPVRAKRPIVRSTRGVIDGLLVRLMRCRACGLNFKAVE